MRDGHIRTDDGTEFRPGLTEAEFLKTQTGAASKLVVHNGPYGTYLLPPMTISGRTFVATAVFCSGTVQLVALCHPVGKKWSDYSATKEEDAVRENTGWLSSAFGLSVPSAFDWGRIESDMDAKSGCNQVSIRYGVDP